MPSIKADIRRCLSQQSGVRNYTETKMKEIQETLITLEKEYEA
jgi:hypothetical protein